MQGNDKQIERVEESAKHPLLDDKVLKSIFDLGDQAFANNLILQYLIKAEKISLQIQDNIKKKKTSEIYSLANELRDSSLYIGTTRIAVISAFIYEHAKKRNIPPLKEAGLYLLKTLEETDSALKVLVSKKKNSEVDGKK